ncbi:poly(A)-specific ribonuclease PARN [Plasmodium gonderi]|uniref:Poly(A)-specific ribonuclease PARN n=1 Tax=Plasmodium gonderi TaxID=77519 RepID=A0A1Y1JJL7_PLAGO|nr:poly(A)-specific ribonuclease PARN [Plasmodium gonderi]GAW82651.1 poly(A)-specific ribonuclease PARN [Plasmodium gonderi]
MASVLNYLFKNFVLKEKNTILKCDIWKRRYSKITSVNVNNWNNIHKEIINKINDSDFVSIDVEYTGLHLKDERYISIDSSYEAHCYGAKSFFPCQIGITVARKKDVILKEKCTADEDYNFKKRSIHNIKLLGHNSEKIDRKYSSINYQEWEISPYCIYVFPKENKCFSVSTTTLIFLKENNFDFNEWIFNGVGYLTPNEEEERKKNIFEKIDELKNLMNKCNTKTRNTHGKECNGKKKKIDIEKIIHEIENYKIVDDEDKEAVIEIIKKIGVWLSQGAKDNPVENFIHQGDKTKLSEKDDCKNMCPIHESENGEKASYSRNNNVGSPKNGNKANDNNSMGTSCHRAYRNCNEEDNNSTPSGRITDSVGIGTYNDILSVSTTKNNHECWDAKNEDPSFGYENQGDGEKKTNFLFDSNKIDDDPSDYPLYIEIENPYLRLLAHTLITKYFNDIFCISVKVNDRKHLAIYRTEKDSYKEQIRTFELEIEKINETIGVRLLFDVIIKNKKIIIGHNCFYDILHIYQTFYHDLPNSISLFKNKWTELFPYTFDTKYMNETNEYLYALNGPATLKGLCEYMASLISSSNDFDFAFNFMNGHSDLPHCFIPLVKSENHADSCGEIDNSLECTKGNNSNNEKNEERNSEDMKNYNKCENMRDETCPNGRELFYTPISNHDNNINARMSDEHNAGYDSLLTCLLFILQCHYILRKNNMLWRNVYFNRKNGMNESEKSFFDIFLSMCNKIKIVKTQPNVVSLTSTENYEMARHFYMYGYPNYFKKWEIMKIWSPIWVSLSKVDDQSCWIIAKSDDDAKNIKMIYKMLQNPQFKLCTYEEYLIKFKSK